LWGEPHYLEIIGSWTAQMVQHKRLEDVNLADITGLISGGVAESKAIEYKRQLPGNSDSERKEFLADVVSFANASGGDILYGVDAKDGVPIACPGLESLNADAERLRLESAIRDGIEPRIPGTQIHVVPGGEKGPVLIIRLRRSWIGPHMVTFKGASRFYSRTGAGKFQLNVTEIRSAFGGTAELTEQIRRWRDQRLSLLISNDGPMKLMSNDWLAMHLIPLESMDGIQRIETSAYGGLRTTFPPLASSGWSRRINLEGFATYSANDATTEGAMSYTQVFRSGQIEAVAANLLDRRNGKLYLASVWYEKTIVDGLREYLKGLRDVGIEPPIVVFLAMNGVKGAVMTVSVHGIDRVDAIDRELLVLPEIVVDAYPADPASVLRPAFDAVWNACGLPRSQNYDDQGKWNPRS
jgi:hypothetical protein